MQDSKQKESLPDFIIGGAMKSATSSLHHLLAQHERVYMPDRELHFFCMDDIIQHPDFLFAGQDAHGIPDYEGDFQRNLDWYQSFFEPAQSNQRIGGYSSLYLAAEDAPARIKELLPDVKLIFMLRNPINRTYSHYWHRVKTGRAVFPFEHELEHGPSTLHLRSFYKPQLDRYLQRFEKSQIKIVLFERFVDETQTVVDEMCSFLNLPSALDAEGDGAHRNRSPVPRLYRLQLLINYFSKGLEKRYEDHLPDAEQHFSNWFFQGVLHRIRMANLRDGSRPPMDAELRRRLAAVYRRKNRGLNDLLDLDLSDYWPHVG
jgi:hypothetical protein